MTAREHLVLVLMEECDEVSQRASKALRFGLDEIQPGQDLTNAERLVGELRDLLAVVELLKTDGALPAFESEHPEHSAALYRKKIKIAQFMDYGIKLGTLDGHCRATWIYSDGESPAANVR